MMYRSGDSFPPDIRRGRRRECAFVTAPNNFAFVVVTHKLRKVFHRGGGEGELTFVTATRDPRKHVRVC